MFALCCRFLAHLTVGSLLLIASMLTANARQLSAENKEQLLIGTWILDVEASDYSPGPIPEHEMRTYKKHGDKIKGIITRIARVGNSKTLEYIADYDSLEYPVMGSRIVSSVKLQRVTARSSEVIIRHAGRILGTARRVISEDGNTMTISYRGQVEQNQVNNVAVYRRQESP